MVLYEQLGYVSIEEYMDDFFNTLLVTNHNYDFFVDWQKVYSNLEEHLIQISILNTLNKVSADNIESKFRKILIEYPEVVPLLPSILAIRNTKSNNNSVDIYDGDYHRFVFSEDGYDVDEIIDFSKKTGILSLFKNINDLHDYLLGTEVGLDTNSRKNRSGTSFENFVENMLKKELESFPEYSLLNQYKVDDISRNKRADFIIYKDNVQKVIIECNFYSASGSKPMEVANSYIELQQELSDEGLIFIWITDGLGWNKMSRKITEVMPKIDFLTNMTILKNNFHKIIDYVDSYE